MKTIRHGVFETNSSSCHVVTLLSDNELEELKNGELLLTVYKSQGEKVVTHTITKFRFEYEIQECQFCFDYETHERKYVDIDRKIRESLTENLWNLLTARTHSEVEDYDQKLNNIFEMYDLDESFVEEVKDYISHVQDRYSVEFLLSNMVNYDTKHGDIQHFSCHEVEC